uniref:Tubulin tyrosine ligase like 8 n=1 Tax=Rhinolophus ferrumequinum TaxID=59479 RepID=A0A671EIU2_RHIFE
MKPSGIWWLGSQKKETRGAGEGEALIRLGLSFSFAELKRGLSQDLTSSPKLDRYKIARQLAERAIKEKKIFSIYGHYPVVRAALRRRGWVEKKSHFPPKGIASVQDGSDGVAENQGEALGKMEDIHDAMARLVKNEMPYFLWTIKRDIVDCRSLHCDQMLNHYGKTASFTTKIGLCWNLRSLPWYVQANPNTFFPRCYSLCTESEKQAFLDDFRLTMASSILKWVVSHQNCSRSKARNRREEAGNSDLNHKTDPENDNSKLTGLSEQLVVLACKVCQDYLGQLEHEDIDVSEDAAQELTEDEWRDLTQQYYSLIRGDVYISNSRNHFSQCQALLNKISCVNPQTEIDGLQNIWIVKPAAKSRGRDIVCMNRVEEILQLVAPDHLSAKDNKWVVQKYIETPLLIYDTKFDIRQWFLVTDWNPLTIWFYKDSYLRFSTQRFSLDNLDSAIHLCNNSIQKYLKNDKGRSPLLPQHNMWTSSRFQEYLQQRGQGSAWGSVIYPSMKQVVADTMQAAQGCMEPRRNSFELYGADFVLGRDFRPWLIEINSSPTMHPSTPVTAQLCPQVQEDIISVVVGRRDDRCCDVGNFELLWRQPSVGLPPFQGPNLCVEGLSVRKARKHMPPISSFKFPSSVLDVQPPKVSPLALPGPTPEPPQTAAQQHVTLKDAKVLSCSLPKPLKRPAVRGCKVKSIHTESGGRVELPACDFQHVDNKAAKTGLTKARCDRHSDTSGLKEHSLLSMLPSIGTKEVTLCQPARPSGIWGAGPVPCPVCLGLSCRARQGLWWCRELLGVGQPGPGLDLARLSG